MNIELLIARINELARKQKTEGLNEEELAERARLREQYLALFRKQVRNHLDTIRFVEDEEQLDEKGGSGGLVH
ncbi:DUF896 domain-containing protein [Paenibacillus apiarius]|uniref:UPF0291 protein M5X09_14250 n=1 Tax=Paenibacillus apiarius TaxID=46240 RepID=A0ABT4DVM9_9BACL|nr:DUF896 domain-containing protein [Paenibacillus apiarius]MCY9515905.1 DUF896 domain-containing protein [Paenibacillus apiarius]MCY9520815.1 DUF896 domain-containing protein [Paenibacillus apiarius]MCY9553520.1 DUF896 domain-containing protein [Paenibacillus apiarius]MCY9557957.1 DUF896 domain-containing protein [Paenibacillus apiarius]MCY9685812.1 DUF896 domain-containing protein [Paenibacillus apiarius]